MGHGPTAQLFYSRTSAFSLALCLSGVVLLAQVSGEASQPTLWEYASRDTALKSYHSRAFLQLGAIAGNSTQNVSGGGNGRGGPDLSPGPLFPSPGLRAESLSPEAPSSPVQTIPQPSNSSPPTTTASLQNATSQNLNPPSPAGPGTAPAGGQTGVQNTTTLPAAPLIPNMTSPNPTPPATIPNTSSPNPTPPATIPNTTTPEAPPSTTPSLPVATPNQTVASTPPPGSIPSPQPDAPTDRSPSPSVPVVPSSPSPQPMLSPNQPTVPIVPLVPGGDVLRQPPSSVVVTQSPSPSSTPGQQVPAGPISSPPPSPNNVVIYLPEQSDTVAGIAERYQTTEEAIRKENSLKSGEQPSPNRLLRVPTPLEARYVTYVVQHWDNLTSVANSNNMWRQQLLEDNKELKANPELRAGQEIQIRMEPKQLARFTAVDPLPPVDRAVTEAAAAQETSKKGMSTIDALKIVVAPVLTGLAAICTIIYTWWKCAKKRRLFNEHEKARKAAELERKANAEGGTPYSPTSADIPVDRVGKPVFATGEMYGGPGRDEEEGYGYQERMSSRSGSDYDQRSRYGSDYDQRSRYGSDYDQRGRYGAISDRDSTKGRLGK